MKNRDFRYFQEEYTDAGAREKFEHVCSELLRHTYPNKNVELITASKGDGGIDIYVGEIAKEPIDVYQCKFFLGRLTSSRRQQIKKSLKTAVNNNNYELKSWVLCIAEYAFSIEDSIWFSELKKQCKKQYDLEIDHMTGEKLISVAKDLGIYDRLFENEVLILLRKIYEKINNESSIDALYSIEERDMRLFRDHLRAFDRPLFHTPSITEESLSDVKSEFKEIPAALKTGTLFSRNNQVRLSFGTVKDYETKAFQKLFQAVIEEFELLQKAVLKLEVMFKQYKIRIDDYVSLAELVKNLNDLEDDDHVLNVIRELNEIDKGKNRIGQQFAEVIPGISPIKLSSEIIAENDDMLIFTVSDRVQALAKKISNDIQQQSMADNY